MRLFSQFCTTLVAATLCGCHKRDAQTGDQVVIGGGAGAPLVGIVWPADAERDANREAHVIYVGQSERGLADYDALMALLNEDAELAPHRGT